MPSDMQGLMVKMANGEVPDPSEWGEARSVGLDRALTAELRQPFAVVKWLPKAATKFRGDGGEKVSGLFLAFLDSSTVSERLSDVDPNWSVAYDRLGATFGEWKAASYATVCHLTVLGVTRSEIGYGSGQFDLDKMKGGYSDSLKRAAWRFGIGAYLRDTGWQVWLPQGEGASANFTTEVDGNKIKIKAVRPPALVELARRYETMVKDQRFIDRYGEVVHYGDVEAELTEAEPVIEALDESPQGLTPIEIAVLELVGGFNGRKNGAAAARQKAEATRNPFDKEATFAIVGAQQYLGLNSADADELRLRMQQAAFSDDVGPFEVLGDWLRARDAARAATAAQEAKP